MYVHGKGPRSPNISTKGPGPGVSMCVCVIPFNDLPVCTDCHDCTCCVDSNNFMKYKKIIW